MAKFILEPYQQERLAEYQEFARRNWGKTYQASEQYLQWLYRENPAPNKQVADFMLALDAETKKIIGVIHKMRLTWLIDGQKVDIPAIHNLLVEEAYRQGSGFFLITASLKGDRHIFVPGVKEPLSRAYDMLRCQLLPVAWYRKILTFWPRKLKCSFADPDSKTIAQITTLLNDHPAATARPCWSNNSVSWRFFHPLGPKHLLFLQNNSLALISLGRRKGFNIARIIEAANLTAELLKEIEQQLKKIGVNVFLIFAATPQLQRVIPYPRLKNPPKTYLYHQDKKDFKDYFFSAAAGDFGLESVLL